MIQTISLFLLTAFFFQNPGAVKKNSPKPLKVVSSFTAYQQAYQDNSNQKLLELKKEIPGIVLDIRYATSNNFMKLAVYKQARAFARQPVVMQLKKVQAVLAKKGYALKIYDAYRPYTATKTLYIKASNKNFVANPKVGSRHNRGCAIDLTLVNLKTGKELEMPTAYDSFSPMAAANYSALPTPVQKNRNLLIQVMQSHGFRVMSNEWWHFDFQGWRNYDLLDIPFEKL
ncbi:M15 family metallopeptidase [Pedobacter gandavensis]|uniref:D-alanyl-D-alanine dipeptidase n=1 Tax=Pedobacter gandavensis TaxID=2679963 RepID=A0ABR6EYC0_9SPHI|nr:M15 family metallopeptidase [Pedobacter gandavensis]MBB2150176.1 D-alanyl-D-alanine dipeptidase [Pedobacter gandavensis]